MKKDFCLIEIKSGSIVNRTQLVKLIHGLKDGRYQVEFSSLNKRSLSQNSYYWLMLTQYVQPALYDAGWREIKTKEDAHEFVGALFLKRKIVNEESGETIERVRSTTELSKVEFNEYLESIWQWAAEYLSITIPAPSEQFVLYDQQ